MKILILSSSVILGVLVLWLVHESAGPAPEPIAAPRPSARRAVDSRRPSPAPYTPAVAVVAPASEVPPVAAAERPEASVADQSVPLQARFATEAVDPGWANTAQQALNDDLGRIASKDVQAQRAECRSSLCRVELTLTNHEAGTAFMESWLRQRTWTGPGFVSTPQAARGGELKMIMFLGRPGSELPYSE